jgi:hypothetical protein
MNRREASPKNNFRNWRLFFGIKFQYELAALTAKADPKGKGMSQVTICKLESGETPYNQWHLELLSATLGVSPGYLIDADPSVVCEVSEEWHAWPLELKLQCQKIGLAMEAQMLAEGKDFVINTYESMAEIMSAPLN